MRIGICGSGGCGKTTLVKAISEELGIPRIDEGVRTWLKKNNIKNLRELSSKDTLRLQEEVLENKIKQENSLGDFIADRTPLDNIAYALRWLSREEGIEEWFNNYYNKAMNHACTYDLIIFLQNGKIPIEDDGVRSTQYWYQEHISITILGLLSKLSNNKNFSGKIIKESDKDSGKLEDRKAMVEKAFLTEYLHQRLHT